MDDVDDELLALAGNGSSSSSRSSSPRGQRRKRRREVEESDLDGSDQDAEGSDEEEETVNPYPLEGIYVDEADRERLLDMPELEREDELAARRDEITKRRQKADLAAMVRNQQDAGRKKSQKAAPSRKKTRKLKRASAPKKTKKKAGSEDDGGEDDYAAASSDDDDAGSDEEEEEEESDYERTTARRGNRSRKSVSQKEASLHKLKKRRSKAEKRRRGEDADDISSEDESSEYDEEAQEILNRKARERTRRERDPISFRREVKATREEERIAQKREYRVPELEEVNAARLRRDHFGRLMHRPDWISQLIGKFARVSVSIPDGSGRPRKFYRLVQITHASQKEKYYEVDEQYTNVCFTSTYGDEKSHSVPLFVISSSPILPDEYQRWLERVQKLPTNKMQRLVPSKEATLDMIEDFEAFINRPFTEQELNEILAVKKEAKQNYLSTMSDKVREQKAAAEARNGVISRAAYDEQLMAQMNEKHRKADRERIAEAERRNAALQKKGINNGSLTAPAAPTPATAVVLPSSNGDAFKLEANKLSSISMAASNIDVDLGDF